MPPLPCFQTLLQQEPPRNPCSSAFGQEVELQHHLPGGGRPPPPPPSLSLPPHPLPWGCGLGRARVARAPCGISAEVSFSGAFWTTGFVLLRVLLQYGLGLQRPFYSCIVQVTRSSSHSASLLQLFPTDETPICNRRFFCLFQ